MICLKRERSDCTDNQRGMVQETVRGTGGEEEMGRRRCFAVLSGVKTSGCRLHHRGPPGLASPLLNLYFISWAKRGKGKALVKGISLSFGPGV